MTIKIETNTFTRLNMLTRQLNDLTEQMARDSRIGKPTRDSHGKLMSEINDLNALISHRIQICMTAMDWEVAETSTESQE